MKRCCISSQNYLPRCKYLPRCGQNHLSVISVLPIVLPDGYENEDCGLLQDWLLDEHPIDEHPIDEHPIEEDGFEEDAILEEFKGNYILGKWLELSKNKN